jgi:hypothetical protein
MSSPAAASARKYIAKRGVATRYGVVPRTIDRWVEKQILPPADRTINTRQYWSEDGLDAHDRAQTVAAGAGKGTKRQPDDQSAHSPPT